MKIEKVNELEGKLEKITGVETGVNGTTTHIIISNKNGNNEIGFPGNIYPDSIGNSVKVRVERIMSGTGFGLGSQRHIGDKHFLKDLNLKREYIGFSSPGKGYFEVKYNK